MVRILNRERPERGDDPAPFGSVPETEGSVQELIRRDQTFAALCQEYLQTDQEIERLRQRCEQIEEELLTRIEGYTPL
jgi:hypothetical protein